MSDKSDNPTATKLFAAYMRAVDKVRALSVDLNAESTKATDLAVQLAAQYGIYVTGSKPAPTRTAPATASSSDSAGVDEAPEFKPPAQHHADAPEIASAGSAEVAEIRRDAGLSEAAADSEELASSGKGMMEQLHKSLPGAPSVVAIPGEHQQTVPEERGNAEGGPVRQGPVEDK